MEQPYIIISLQTKQLFLKKENNILATFPIAIGKTDSPTPLGVWKIMNKKILADSSAFGTHWLGLSLPGYGIHGTNQPELIGSAVSGGCIRLQNQDIQTLFSQVHIGTTVLIQ